MIVARLHVPSLKTICEQWSHPNTQLKPLASSSFWPQVLFAGYPRVPVLMPNTQGALSHTALFICFCTLSSAEGSADNCTMCFSVYFWGWFLCTVETIDLIHLCSVVMLSVFSLCGKHTLPCSSGDEEIFLLYLPTFAGFMGDLQLFVYFPVFPLLQ